MTLSSTFGLACRIKLRRNVPVTGLKAHGLFNNSILGTLIAFGALGKQATYFGPSLKEQPAEGPLEKMNPLTEIERKKVTNFILDY